MKSQLKTEAFHETRSAKTEVTVAMPMMGPTATNASVHPGSQAVIARKKLTSAHPTHAKMELSAKT